MKITNSFHIEFTKGEQIALAHTYEIVRKFYHLADGDETLDFIVPGTGEVVQVKELPRVEGVLDALMSNPDLLIEQSRMPSEE